MNVSSPALPLVRSLVQRGSFAPGWLVVVSLAAISCATPRSGDSPATDALYETPDHWRVVNEQKTDQLVQVNLRSEQGNGRILLGRLKLAGDIGDLDTYLNILHNSLVDRIRGRVSVDPFAQDLVQWDNGLIGYRTKLRGELADNAVIIDGITFSDGDYAYFNYGLFREANYDTGQQAYSAVLASLGPLHGASMKHNTGMRIDQAARGSARKSPSHRIVAGDYRSPKTHLGYIEWGTSRDDILAREGPPLRRGKNALGYRCHFLGIDNCVVIYMFTYGKLTHGGYLIEESYDRPLKYVSRYLKLTGAITKKYGNPQQSAAIWSNPKYRDNGKKWGTALARGQVVFGTVWNLGPAKVVHSLKKNDQGGFDHRILMSDDKLRRQLQQQGQTGS